MLARVQSVRYQGSVVWLFLKDLGWLGWILVYDSVMGLMLFVMLTTTIFLIGSERGTAKAQDYTIRGDSIQDERIKTATDRILLLEQWKMRHEDFSAKAMLDLSTTLATQTEKVSNLEKAVDRVTYLLIGSILALLGQVAHTVYAATLGRKKST